MAPIRAAVHIQIPVYLAVIKGEKTLNDFPELVQGAKDMLDQFAWWLKALKTARDAEASASARRRREGRAPASGLSSRTAA